jgi:hypothetical protein
MERLVDPVVADLQVEYGAAARAGAFWRSRWIRLAGCVAFLKIIAVCTWERLMGAHSQWTVADQTALGRAVVLSAMTIVVFTLLLLVPEFLTYWPASQWWAIGYEIPQTLPMTIPFGFTLGVVLATGARSASRRLAWTLLALATLCSFASYVAGALIAPVAQTALREVLRYDGPIGHGAEVSLSPRHARVLAVATQMRWAFACATLVLALLMITLITRRRMSRPALVVSALVAMFGYYALSLGTMTLGFDGKLSVVSAAWLPNLAVVDVATAIAMVVRRNTSAQPSALSPEPSALSPQA